MLRSLFAAISGLRVNQTMLDVTGNNIANANTAGYKSSQTVFQDTLSQALTGASGPGNGRGGTNPIQVGLGVQLASTTTSFTQGSTQITNNPTDLMINGDGFFVTNNGSEDVYTRAGAFRFDADGNLTTPDGNIVQGYMADGQGNLGAGVGDIRLPAIVNQGGANPLTSYSIGKDGMITGKFADGSQRSLAQVAVADFANPAGLEKIGSTSFRPSANSGGAQVGPPGTDRRGVLTAGSLEMSNVDLAQEFTNLIVAQRGFQASSRVITTSDQVLEELVNIKR
ncbi:flagellar hook-basal body complex protein [Solicola sp. PLA-1-18]|uniref:flagellar hook-basal body complex protein n=1 Tax=Solicola sp. PLA-1-18 TaxID=3380532 RepID=UPI003B7F6FD9